MRLEFDISLEARERLWAVKELQGKSNLSAVDFARELLEKELRRLFPGIPELDDQGRLINPEVYTGSRRG